MSLNLCNSLVWARGGGGGNPPTASDVSKLAGTLGSSVPQKPLCVEQPEKEADFPMRNSRAGSCLRQPGAGTSLLRKSGGNNFHKLERKKHGVQRVLELKALEGDWVQSPLSKGKSGN